VPIHNVLPGSYSGMMWNFFTNAVNQNQINHPIPETVVGIQTMQKEVTSIIKKALGPMPVERTSLNARIIRRIKNEDYSIEVICFESQPGIWVTANLYLPNNISIPAPAILMPHGHYLFGKTQPAVQLSCIGLARRGFVVMALDTMGYGERGHQGHEDNLFLLMAGRSLMALEVWDNMRALDYLCTRPEVDQDRIGCTGASGGGAQTVYTTILDPRIKAAVPVCSVATIDGIYYGGIYCSCECLPGVASGWDISEIAALIAPRPLMVISGILDKLFLIEGARKAAGRLRQVYQVLNLPKNFAYVEVYNGHGYNREMRLAMYKWFIDKLQGPVSGDDETPAGIEPNESPLLSVGKIINVKKQLSNIPFLVFNQAVKELSSKWPKKPAHNYEWTAFSQTLRHNIINLFGNYRFNPDKVRQVSHNVTPDSIRENVVIESEPGIWLPAQLFMPKGSSQSYPAVIFLRDEGKTYAANLSIVAKLLSKGIAVLTLDYRGIGETEPVVPRPLSEDPEVMLTQSSIIIGRPLFGMRVLDVMAAATWLKRHPAIDFSRVYCWGAYGASLLALYSSGLTDLFAGTILHNPIITYAPTGGYVTPTYAEGGVVSYRASKVPLRLPSFFLPGILQYGDVAHVASLVAPRPLLIAGGVCGDGEQASPGEITKYFDWTQQIYKLLESDSLSLLGQDTEDCNVIIKWLKDSISG